MENAGSFGAVAHTQYLCKLTLQSSDVFVLLKNSEVIKTINNSKKKNNIFTIKTLCDKL